jgi:hypothetical protein
MRILAVLVLALAPAAGTAGKLDEGASKELVERWLKAQNAQDFAAYQALYARKFDGIKRAGRWRPSSSSACSTENARGRAGEAPPSGHRRWPW